MKPSGTASQQQSKSRFTTTPLTPLLFKPQFDLLQELRSNKDSYASEEVQLSIRSFPTSLILPIDQTRTRAIEKSRDSIPGRNLVIVVCLQRGIGLLARRQEIKDLIALKRKLSELDPERVDQDYADLIGSISLIFERFSMRVSDTEGDYRRQGVHLGKRLHNALFSMKSDLGISLDSLAVLCIQSTLCESDVEWVFKEHKHSMEESIERFLKAAKRRVRLLKLLMEALEE